MFDKKSYKDRLSIWVDFRNTLEHSNNPFQDVLDYYSQANLVSIQVDPFDQNSWLGPWDLILENEYCNFAVVLGIAYTLQLTERFSCSQFEIHIITDYENSELKYLLYIDDTVIDYQYNRVVLSNDISPSYKIEKIYSLEPL
jgi:hypothetical protein